MNNINNLIRLNNLEEGWFTSKVSSGWNKFKDKAIASQDQHLINTFHNASPSDRTAMFNKMNPQQRQRITQYLNQQSIDLKDTHRMVNSQEYQASLQKDKDKAISDAIKSHNQKLKDDDRKTKRNRRILGTSAVAGAIGAYMLYRKFKNKNKNNNNY